MPQAGHFRPFAEEDEGEEGGDSPFKGRLSMPSRFPRKPSDRSLFSTWKNMRQRCYQPTNKNFHLYGGRGIRVCDRWQYFANFVADMGERPPGHSLDRIDVNGNYEPENCRWATQAVQSRNQRRNKIVEHNGERKCVTDWARTLGIPPSTLFGRIRKGMAFADAVAQSAF